MSILMAFAQISFPQHREFRRGQIQTRPRSSQLFDQANQLRLQTTNASNAKTQQDLCAVSKRADTPGKC